MTSARVVLLACLALALSAPPVRAQSPELSLREFSSGQIKKGVRSIGFGGDGATWGNYGLVWRDADTALVDGGDTHYTNGNDFHFAALGLTSPALWQGLVIYGIGLSEDSNRVHLKLKTPALGKSPVAMTGTGGDHAFFSKIAMPLGDNFSAGILLSYEQSHFDAAVDNSAGRRVLYKTEWRPSGGFGIAWQPDPKVLIGFRALFNNDMEHRLDANGSESTGLAHSAEYRLGASYSPWDGALFDVGGTHQERHNGLAGTTVDANRPNLGIEQAFLARRLIVRAGLDETSPTAGISYKLAPFNLDVAYVHNMAHARVGDLFGTESNSVIATLTLDYKNMFASGK
jgi:hypothetical protein